METRGKPYWHVYPIDHEEDHSLVGTSCWCRPKVRGSVVIHNNLEETETCLMH